MVRRVSPSELQRMLREAARKQQQTIDNYNRAESGKGVRFSLWTLGPRPRAPFDGVGEAIAGRG